MSPRRHLKPITVAVVLGNGLAIRIEGSGAGVIQDNVLGGNKANWRIAKDRANHVKRDRNVEDYRA